MSAAPEDPAPHDLAPDSGDEPQQPEPVALLEPREGTPPTLTTQAELAQLCRRLAEGAGPVAVDAERASGYRYSQRAYLVQLRRNGSGTALIDPIALPDLSSVNDVLNGVEWVLHAANQDLACLAEVGLVPRVLFDTELAGRLAGFERVGLGAMVEKVLGLTLEKGHSAADWSTRPLPAAWLTYAALDVEVLIELRDALDAELRAQGKREWAAQEFDALVAAVPPPPRIDPWRRTSGIHKLRTRRQLAAVRSLWQARDRVAERRDIAPGRVLPDAAILAAVTADPPTPAELLAVPVFGGRANRKMLHVWFDALATARAMTDHELPAHTPVSDAPPPVNRWADRDPVAAARLAAARAALLTLSTAHRIPVENLLTPDLVRRTLWAPPADGSDAAVATALRASGARSWQVELMVPLLRVALQAQPATIPPPA